MFNVLIVYEEIPEATKFYACHVSSADWEWIQLTHNNFVNTEMASREAEEACNKLTEWLQVKQPLSMKGPLEGKSFDFIVHTGFVL